MDTISLPKRQEQILFALADGLSTEEITNELGLSVQTIANYVKKLLSNLEARNRTHAVALGYHYGLLIPRQQL